MMLPPWRCRLRAHDGRIIFSPLRARVFLTGSEPWNSVDESGQGTVSQLRQPARGCAVVQPGQWDRKLRYDTTNRRFESLAGQHGLEG